MLGGVALPHRRAKRRHPPPSLGPGPVAELPPRPPLHRLLRGRWPRCPTSALPLPVPLPAATARRRRRRQHRRVKRVDVFDNGGGAGGGVCSLAAARRPGPVAAGRRGRHGVDARRSQRRAHGAARAWEDGVAVHGAPPPPSRAASPVHPTRGEEDGIGLQVALSVARVGRAGGRLPLAELPADKGAERRRRRGAGANGTRCRRRRRHRHRRRTHTRRRRPRRRTRSAARIAGGGGRCRRRGGGDEVRPLARNGGRQARRRVHVHEEAGRKGAARRRERRRPRGQGRPPPLHVAIGGGRGRRRQHR